jgi:dipeptidyl aminopeptidase/acylaminoacyl peptidase
MKGAIRGVGCGRSDVVENRQRPGLEHEPLDVIIGKWINEGHTVATENAPSSRILTSDIYEWSTGGFFVLHTAYGRVGDLPGGGIEIIGYDAASGGYISRFFDSRGNVSTHELSIEGDAWTWQGESTRCTAFFTDGGGTQTAYHERLDERGEWVPSMEVTLTKIV